MTLILSSCVFSQIDKNVAFAQQSVEFREFIDTFDGYSFNYPKNWIQVKGANADIFFRDPYVLDENLSVEVSSPSSSKYKSVEDLGPPEEAGKAVLRQYLTEFMSTRLGVRRESSILSTSSRVADDGKMYYQIEVRFFQIYVSWSRLVLYTSVFFITRNSGKQWDMQQKQSVHRGVNWINFYTSIKICHEHKYMTRTQKSCQTCEQGHVTIFHGLT